MYSLVLHLLNTLKLPTFAKYIKKINICFDNPFSCKKYLFEDFGVGTEWDWGQIKAMTHQGVQYVFMSV